MCACTKNWSAFSVRDALQHAGLAVPHRHVGEQLADLRLDRVAVGAVPAVLQPHPDRPRRHRVVPVEVEQLAADPHLPARVIAERQVAAVDQEAARDRPGAGDDRRDGLVRTSCRCRAAGSPAAAPTAPA